MGWEGNKTRKGRGEKNASSQGNAQASKTRSKLPPCAVSSHTNGESQEQSFHLQSLPHMTPLSQLWSQVQRLCWHMPVLVYELVTTSKAAWPKACPLFKGSFKLQNRIFPRTPLRTLRWVTEPLASSLDSPHGILWGLHSRGAVHVMQYERTFYPPIQSRKTLKILCER